MEKQPKEYTTKQTYLIEEILTMAADIQISPKDFMECMEWITKNSNEVNVYNKYY